MSDLKAQIEAANANLAAGFEACDAAAMAACYTEDAQVMATGMDFVTGLSAIEQFWGGAVGGDAKTLVLSTMEIDDHGDTVIEVGRGEFFGADGALLDTAKYVVIWKNVDGAWKLHRDIFNSNTPAG